MPAPEETAATGAASSAGGTGTDSPNQMANNLRAARLQEGSGKNEAAAGGEEEGEQANDTYTLFDALRDVIFPFKFEGGGSMEFVKWFNEGMSSANIKRALVWVFLSFFWWILAAVLIISILAGPALGFVSLVKKVVPGI